MHKQPKDPVTVHKPLIVPRSEHSISRSLIDPDALKVLYRLNRHGHIAYLVGGGVRDILLGKKPKDFDISTSAHPNQVRKVFSNCRLIGRRFRLAHIYFKAGKIIEVATFRTLSVFDPEEGFIQADNTFGTPVDDVFRRDFTVNALFYNIADFSVIDYVGGLEDLKARVVRCIGDPEVRFQEDSIRMLRGIRFAAFLNFDLDPVSYKLIKEMRNNIWDSATPRILEEIFRMLGRGTSSQALKLMYDLGVLETLFPELASHIRKEGINQYLEILTRLDNRFNDTGELPPYLVVASLLYPWFEWHTGRYKDHDYLHLAKELLPSITQRLQIPRRIQDTVRQMLAAQVRFYGLRTRRYKPGTILRKSYFESSMDLFSIVASGTDEGRELIMEWEKLKSGKKNQGHQRQARKRNKRRRRRGPGATSDKNGR